MSNRLAVIPVLCLVGLSVPGIPSALASLGVGHTGMAAAVAASRLGLSGLTPSAGHNVLLVSNLNPQVCTRTLRPVSLSAALRDVPTLPVPFV